MYFSVICIFIFYNMWKLLLKMGINVPGEDNSLWYLLVEWDSFILQI